MKIQHIISSDGGREQDGIPEFDFRNWYAMSIRPGREMKFKAEITTLTDNQYYLFVPSRELFYRFNGTYQKVIKPLFPGYLFIHKEIESLVIDIQHSHLDGIVRPVMFDSRFVMVRESEMALLMKIAGPEGLVKASKVMSGVNQTAIIKSGPLKEITGRILYINMKKRKAALQVELMNKKVKVVVGLEVVEPSSS